MLYGELGRYPISITIKCRMVHFWSKLLASRNKISFNIYSYLLNQQLGRSKWLSEIKSILDKVGLSQFWPQNVFVPPNLHKLVRQILIDQYHQEWNAQLNSSNKGKTYQLIKQNLEFESYLKILPLNDAINLFRFRHKLPIETGRWDGILIEHRKCNLCLRDEVGSERHYLLSCHHFNVSRRKYFPDTDLSDTEYNYKQLMQSVSSVSLTKTAHFVKLIMTEFNSLKSQINPMVKLLIELNLDKICKVAIAFCLWFLAR